MLTNRMKREAINCIVHYSKALIEDTDTISKAYDDGEVTTEELEDYIDEIRDYLIDSLR